MSTTTKAPRKRTTKAAVKAAETVTVVVEAAPAAPALTPLPGRTQLLELTDDQAAAARRLKGNRAQLAALKRLVDADTAILKAAAGDTAMIGVADNVPLVRFGDGTWNGTDDKLLEEAFPEAYAATRLSKDYVTVSPL
jgi:hypothetical protein